jgi:hypothetical protein
MLWFVVDRYRVDASPFIRSLPVHTTIADHRIGVGKSHTSSITARRR